MPSGLTTDLYQLTMVDAYLRTGMANKTAVFNLFVRSLPGKWNRLVVCGIQEALKALETLCFTGEDVNYVRSLGLSAELCDYLLDFRFEGNVCGMPEGTVAFANEPIMEVTGTLAECQLVETMLLNIINYQTLVCTKAARIVQAAGTASIVDFGLRRAPGPEAGVWAARAAYIAGAVSTSNVEAGRRYGIPVSGTHAHSFVMAFPSEIEAFRAWCKTHPKGTTLLIDTYDIEQGARNACKVAKEGAALQAVRIDSGVFEESTHKVRRILDNAGLGHVRILVSGDMNEYKIVALRDCACPIDGYGVGTDMVTARPEAALGGVYKLVEVDGRPCVKLSAHKVTYPGEKDVWRVLTRNGSFSRDVITSATERGRPTPTEGVEEALLVVLMTDGDTHYVETIDTMRNRCRHDLELIPDLPIQAQVSYGLQRLYETAVCAIPGGG